MMSTQARRHVVRRDFELISFFSEFLGKLFFGAREAAQGGVRCGGLCPLRNCSNGYRGSGQGGRGSGGEGFCSITNDPRSETGDWDHSLRIQEDERKARVSLVLVDLQTIN